MDRSRFVNDLSLRRIALLFAAAVALAMLVLFRLAMALFQGELAGGGAGMPVDAVWGAMAATFLAILGLWAVADRLMAARQHDRRGLPARPEFYDLNVAERPLHGAEIAGKTLRELTFVAFDTETTGLDPAHGDEIISIAAVRLRDGEIDEARSFSRLVDPGRPIPPASIRFHGITDDMVAGEPTIGEVLPEFREFVGDAVLVGHNADFDMTFLAMKAQQTGVEIANIVLDTLLISVFVDHAARHHSLDAVAERLGIEIEGRHSALGDSIATARIFWKLRPRLEARGITTLGQLVEACAPIERQRRAL